MREGAAASSGPSSGDARDALPDAPLGLLLRPKWLTARARATQGDRGRGARASILGGTGLLFWALSFGVLHRLLQYFRGVEEIGPVLAGKLLGLLLVGFGSILLLSNVITALSSFFLAKDLDLLVAAPVDWLRVYAAKLLETLIASRCRSSRPTGWCSTAAGGSRSSAWRSSCRTSCSRAPSAPQRRCCW